LKSQHLAVAKEEEEQEWNVLVTLIRSGQLERL